MSLALAMVLGMTACGANGSRDSGGEKTETVKKDCLLNICSGKQN